MDRSEAEKLLGVSADSSESKIKDAFRAKAKQYHPDQSDDPRAVEKFQECEKAKRTLLDDELRDDSVSVNKSPDTSSQTGTSHDSPNEYHTRSETGPISDTSTSHGGVAGASADAHRVKSNVWTGLSLSELFVLVRHYTLPYLQTYWLRGVNAAPIWLVLIVGAGALVVSGGVVTGYLQLGLVVGIQYGALWVYINYLTYKRNLKFRRNEFEGIPAVGTHRSYAPIIGCGLALYLIYTISGAPLGGVIPSIAVSIMFLLMTVFIGVLLISLTNMVVDDAPGGSIVLIAAVIAFVLGFTTIGSPAFFGTSEAIYILFGKFVVLGVDLGLFFNVLLSSALLYSTIGFYILTTSKIARYVEVDYNRRFSVHPSIWYIMAGLPLTLFFWVGVNPRIESTVLGAVDPGLLAAFVVASPGYVYALYRLKRGIQMYVKHPEKFQMEHIIGR